MKEIKTKKAPEALGPYSQAIAVGELLFCSGQIALDPENGEMISGGVKDQTWQVLENLREILRKAGVGLERVVKVEVFLTEMGDFEKVNEVYKTFFASSPKPSRSLVAVKALPKGALVEISCIASLNEKEHEN